MCVCLPLPVVHTYLLMCCSAWYIWHVRGRRTFPLSGIHRIRDAYLPSIIEQRCEILHRALEAHPCHDTLGKELQNVVGQPSVRHVQIILLIGRFIIHLVERNIFAPFKKSSLEGHFALATTLF